MTVLVATDLDRTLVYSRRSRGPVDPAALHGVEDRRGTTVSWTTHRSAALLAELDRRTTWVPSTTRTVEEFRRLRLPRAPAPGPRYAVCAHGGVLLVDGQPDAGWTTRVRRIVAGAAGIDELAARLARVAAALPEGTIGPVCRAEGFFLVAPLDRARPPDEWAEELAAWAAPLRWRVRVHGAKLYALPEGLTKAAAIEEVVRRRPGGSVLAAGDSLLDLDLLLRADAAIRPAHGELHALGWRADHVAVTARAGVHAGEEIAAWLLDKVS